MALKAVPTQAADQNGRDSGTPVRTTTLYVEKGQDGRQTAESKDTSLVNPLDQLSVTHLADSGIFGDDDSESLGNLVERIRHEERQLLQDDRTVLVLDQEKKKKKVGQPWSQVKGSGGGEQQDELAIKLHEARLQLKENQNRGFKLGSKNGRGQLSGSGEGGPQDRGSMESISDMLGAPQLRKRKKKPKYKVKMDSTQQSQESRGGAVLSLSPAQINR